MENPKIIEFQMTRDFGSKVSTTFAFVVQNYRGLLRSILYIAGPPVLVASLLLSSFVADIFSLGLQTGRGNQDAFLKYFTNVNFWLQIGLALIFFIVSLVVTTATLNNYLILYREKKTHQIEVSDVWERVRNTFWMYLGTTLLFGLLAIVAYILLTIPIIVFAAISTFLIFFGAVLLIIGILYLVVTTSLVYVVQAFEHKGFFESIARSFYLVRGKWWSTFGLYMVLSMLVGVISSIFIFPAYIIMIVQSLHNVQTNNFQGPSGITGTVVLIFITLYYLSQMVLSCLPNIGLALQYFNLVEMKEAKGLLGQIETLGQSSSPSTEEHY